MSWLSRFLNGSSGPKYEVGGVDLFMINDITKERDLLRKEVSMLTQLLYSFAKYEDVQKAKALLEKRGF